MRRLSSVWTVAALMLICIVAVAWHYTARGRGKISTPETGVFLILRAPQRVFTSVGVWFGDVGRAMFRRPSIVTENDNLRSQVDNLEGENQRLRRYLRENQELRQLLKMPKPWAGRYLPADVVSLNFSDYTQKIFLNVGANQGVLPKDVVFTARGVVGQVVRTNNGIPATSEVLLLTDRSSSIGAMTARSMAKGIVQGTGERICKMTYLDYQADVREGDLVLTSGDSTIFPRGLVIGRVLKVEKNKTYSTMSAYIDPAVPFDRISAVYVRTRPQ
jgi:rod shape-determining protein MreC